MSPEPATVPPHKDDGISLRIAVLCLMISACLFFAGALGRMGMPGPPNFIPFAFSVCLILLPSTIRSLIACPSSLMQFLTLAVFFVLGWISIALDINLSFVVVLTSVGCLLHLLRAGRRTNMRIPLKAVLPYLALGVSLVGLVWTQDYMNPLSPEAFAAGFAFTHTDTLFHAALTSNIKTYCSPSTGLYGLEHMTYHHGAHYLFAAYSQLCEMDVVQFYSSGYPVIFIPLFVQTLLNAAFASAKHNANATALTISGITLFFIINGFYPLEFGMRYLLPSAVNTHFLSQSYCISLILTFIAISLYRPLFSEGRIVASRVGNAILILLVPVCLFIIGYTKVSTAVVLLSAFLYLIVRTKLYRQRWIVVAAAAAIVSMFGLFELTIEDEGSNFQIQPGSYYKHFVQGNVFIYFITYYLPFALLTGMVIVKQRESFSEGIRSGKYIVLEVIAVSALSGILPGLLIYIDGGSAYYFADIQYWLTAAALIYHVPGFIQTFTIFRSKRNLRFAYAVIAIVVLAKATLEVAFFARKNIQIRTALVYGNNFSFKQLLKSTPPGELGKSLLLDVRSSPYYQKVIKRSNLDLLDSIRSLPRSIKSHAILYCEDPEQLGEFLNCGQAIFYLPAVAEMALVNGLYWRDKCYVIDEYGMRPYISYPSKVSFANAPRLAASQGFKYLITINLGKGTYRVEDLQKKVADLLISR